MLTIQTSTLNAPPDATPKFIYQLCSDCAPLFVIRAVPGYIPGVCNGCILDAVFDFPSSTLDAYSSTSTSTTLSSTAGLPAGSIDASSTIVPGLTNSQSIIPSFTVTSATGRSHAVDATTTPVASGGGLVTVVTATETLTEIVTSTIYLPALPGYDGTDRMITTCYPVTTCSELTATVTIPPESCTTYTTTNEVNNQVETCTEPVPWWTPSFPTSTPLPAPGSQDALPEIADSPNQGPATDNLAEPEAGSNSPPQPAAGNKISASPGFQADEASLPNPNAAPTGDVVEASGNTSGSSGFGTPAQPQGEPNVSPDAKLVDSQNGSSSLVLPSPPNASVGLGKTTSVASDDRAGSDIPSPVAQGIGCRARRTTATEALIVVIGVTLLLVCL